MGGGSWSTEFYRDQEEVRRKAGVATFAHSAAMNTKAYHEQTVHEDLDPKGVEFRESRDSEEHPESNAVAVFFDVTGSMGHIPQELQKRLPNLMDTLNASGYLPDPQVFFGAVGDTTCDRGSLQVGQFESDNRANAAFECMWIESGGGGGNRESYQNAMYFAARHMELDCVTKRNKKGYLFMIGDEMPYDNVSKAEINTLMGDGILQDDISLEDLVTELQAKFEIFMIIPQTFSGRQGIVQSRWRELLGQNVIISQNMDDICETIAMAIGINEGVDLETARTDLQNNGASAEAVNSSLAALSGLAGDSAPRNLRL